MNGGIISAALGLIKEKERQGDKAMDRLHDSLKTQMELTANQGSWTGDSKSSGRVTKEKVVEKEKVKEHEKEDGEDVPPSAATPSSDGSMEDADEKRKGGGDMGIFELAQGASK